MTDGTEMLNDMDKKRLCDHVSLTLEDFTMVNFIVSHACNMKCRSCINGDAQKQHSRLDAGTMKGVIDNVASWGNVKSVHFSGGEPFLFKDALHEVAAYASQRHGITSAATTNCFWARNAEDAYQTLSQLQDGGFVGLGVSIDEYHEEFIDIARIRYALEAADQLGLHCRIQSAVTKTSKKVEDYKEALGLDSPYFRWQNVPCIPLGYGSSIGDDTEFYLKSGVPMGDCTLGRTMTVYPDGDVSLCSTSRQCAAHVYGNLADQSCREIVEGAHITPKFNAIRLWWGPRLLADLLAEHGMAEYAEGNYTHVCHSCYAMSEDPRAMTLVEEILPGYADILLEERLRQSHRLAHETRRLPWVLNRQQKPSR